MKKKRILWISDSPVLPTGNGKITRNFINGVHKKNGYEIAVLARGYRGWPGEREKVTCTLYPMDIGKPYPDLMREICREFGPDVVISCLDMCQIDWIEHAKQSEAVTNIGYISIYGKPVPFEWKKIVKNLDLAICYSEFGKSVLKEFMPFTSIDMIHLGVDTDLYRPLDNREEIRKKYKLTEKFVVGCIARNQIRKRIDKLIEGFSLFAREHDNAVLYLKTEKNCPHGYNIPDLLAYYNIKEKVIIHEHKNNTGFSEEEVVEMYNVFDVYVQTAGAEGFGLPLLEAMSCGVPVMAPDYSACHELIDGKGILLKPYFPRIVDMASVEQVSINTRELCEELQKLHSNTDKLKEMGSKGRAFAQTLTWNRFTERWMEILSNVAWRV